MGKSKYEQFFGKGGILIVYEFIHIFTRSMPVIKPKVDFFRAHL